MKTAIIRLLDVEGEAPRITVLEQPVHSAGYHVYTISDPNNLANLLDDLAGAVARRMRKPHQS